MVVGGRAFAGTRAIGKKAWGSAPLPRLKPEALGNPFLGKRGWLCCLRCSASTGMTVLRQKVRLASWSLEKVLSPGMRHRRAVLRTDAAWGERRGLMRFRGRRRVWC